LIGATRRALLGGLSSALLPGAAGANAALAPRVLRLPGGPPRSVLFVGNSFFRYNRLHEMVRALAATAPGAPSVRVRAFTASGATFADHDLEAYYREAASEPATPVRAAPPFDVVVLADCSNCVLRRDGRARFTELGHHHAAIARQNGAQPVLFMTWAWGNRPEMMAPVVDAYLTLGNSIGALIIPAGLAFVAARAARPEVDLYARDNRHPSLEGSYLAAATTVATLFGTEFGSTYAGLQLDPAVAGFLRSTAAATTRDFLAGRLGAR
jgi:hypothetical protein